MKYTGMFAAAMFAALSTMGCGQPAAPAPAGGGGSPIAATSEPAHAPHGEGPNGGVVFDLGAYHAEFTVDHPKKEVTILFLDADGKAPKAAGATELTVSTKETKTAEGTVVAPMTITLKPVDAADGKATKFVGTDPGVGNVADFAGSVVGEIDGKPAQGEFTEEAHGEHGHDHDH